MTLREKTFENIVQKEEIAVYKHFLLFPIMFLPILIQILSLIHFVVFQLGQAKNSVWVKS